MSDSEISVCHITVLHNRYDTRIFLKECRSLAKVYKTFLIVADGEGDEEKEGVQIIDVGLRAGSFLKRFFLTSFSIYKRAKGLNCRIYHFHDPEFLYWAYRLLSKEKKVVFDAHEDLPKQILRKEYIPAYLRPALSKFSGTALHSFTKRFSAVIAATPTIKTAFHKSARICEDICNYVIDSEFRDNPEYSKRENNICYLGGITEARGIRELMLSIESLDPLVKLEIAGKFENATFRNEITMMKSWERAKFHGFVGRNEIYEILGRSRVGMLILHPDHGYLESLPVKLFEYMAAGIPVVASDFPLWKEILEGNNCGICVDPFDTAKISERISFLINNNEIAEKMGKSGCEAIKQKYNWANEEVKLLNIYSLLLT
jgi:glycosyltransferase involved in cell wall biosynthesis